MRIDEEVKLDFDDVLIRPKRSDAPSRKSVQLERTFKTLHSQRTFTCIPICASNMDTTGTFAMAQSLYGLKCLCALHKFYSEGEIYNFYRAIPNYAHLSLYTLGIRPEDFEKFKYVLEQLNSLPFICLDAANAYTKYFVQRLREIRQLQPLSTIVAGNVATPEMVQELILEGADIVKVGIGPGSHCLTRLMTGVGYPQLSAIIECADAAHGLGGLIMADGGCKTQGDICKAFGAGADFVMLGGMLAGTKECQGEWCNGYLKVYGMSSKEAQEKYYGKVKEYIVPEGDCSLVALKGPVKFIIQEIFGGLRSFCSYIGSSSLKTASRCTTFIRVQRIK